MGTSFLGKLKSLVNVDISKLREIRIQILSGNTKTQVTNNILILDPEKFNSKQKKLIQEITKGSIKEDALVLEEQSNKLLEDFSKYNSETNNQQILDYFNGKLPPTDVGILRAALYLKAVHDRGNQPELASKLKSDIVQRWGKRGANIANLCTAGYFTTIVKPLYEELSSKPDFNRTMFEARYETIVMQYPFAVFVNRKMNIEELKKSVEEKIKINKKYGIKKLNIHAIGRDNIDKINKALSDIKNLLTDPPEVDSGQNYIIVTIWF